jgi:signal transduction histidine kinase
MKSKILKQDKLLRLVAARLFSLFVLITIMQSALGATLLIEHFDEKVPDYSPIGNAPGWRVLVVKGGVVFDCTTNLPGFIYDYPALSSSYGGARSGPGQWSVGFLTLIGNVVSNALIWVEAPTNFQGHAITGFSYYSRNDSAASSTRIVVRANGRWYASTTSVHDSGVPADWVLNTLRFTTSPGAWQELNTNNLTLGSKLSQPLPTNNISAVGFYCLTAGRSRMRLDEFRVVTGSVWDQDFSVGSWIWAEQRMDRVTCRLWKLIEIPSGVRVKRAQLRMTAHDTFRAFLDGTEFGRGSDWGRLTEYDLTRVLSPGRHVLAVEAFNEYEWAGLVAGLVVELSDGKVMKFPSDDTWRIVPEDSKGWLTADLPENNWPAATLLFPFRDAPGIPDSPKVDSSLPLQPIVIQFWQTGWFQVTLLSFCGVVVGICLRLLAKVTMQSKEQQVLQRERARIARDIHDDLGAVVTQLVLQGETAQSELPGESEARAKFKRISDTGRRLVQSINEVVWMVNSQRDSLQDFENYVCRYAENFLRASSIRCRLDVDGEIPEAAFDLARRRSLFLAIKEALNNAAKHSGATEVLLKLQIEKDDVKVTVEDNGRGFDPAARDRTRNGLSNMAQRMTEVGGKCQIVSRPGAGCRVELSAKVSHLSDHHSSWWRLRDHSSSTLGKKEIQP